MSTFLIIFALLLSSSSFAATEALADNGDQVTPAKENYDGMVDDEPLSVQKQLPTPVIKVYKKAVQDDVFKRYLKSVEDNSGKQTETE